MRVAGISLGFVVLFSVLASLAAWHYVLGDPAERGGLTRFSTPLIADTSLLFPSLERYAERGDADVKGFMTYGAFADRRLRPSEASLLAVEPAFHDAVVLPYFAHASAQYLVARTAISFGMSPRAAYRTLSVALAATSALLIAGLAWWAKRAFSPLTAVVLLLAFTASHIFWAHAASLYWVFPLAILPLALSALLYEPLRKSIGGWLLFGGALASAMCLKCLVGYEFITVIAVSAVLPVAYAEFRDKPAPTFAVLSLIALRCALVMGFCVIGFLAAVLLHLGRIEAAVGGGFSHAIDVFVGIMSYSTHGDLAEFYARNKNFGLLGIVESLVSAFVVKNLQVNVVLWGALFVGAVLYLRARLPLTNPIQGLLWCLPIALFGLLSWHIFAFNHAFIHPHRLWIAVHLTLYPVLIPLTVLLLEGWFRARKGASQTAGPLSTSA